MNRSSRHAVLIGVAVVVATAVVAVLYRPGAGTPADDLASSPRLAPLTDDAAPTAAPAPTAGQPALLERPGRGALAPDAMTASAAEDYRRQARYPHASRPLDDAAPDPLQRDREVSPVVDRGPHGDGPALTVRPMLASFEEPEPAVLYAELAIDGSRIPARSIRGTVLTDALRPVAELEYRDDGTGGDAVADDHVYTAVFAPPANDVPARSYLVQVVATSRGDEERHAATSFLYSRPDARLTGEYRDAAADGSLDVGVEVDVAASGRFHVEATLYDAAGTRPLAWAQAAAALEPGRHWLTLPFYGLILREKGVDGPYQLRWVALSTTTAMPNAKNRLVDAAYRTAPYTSASFTDRPFDDPGLLETAARIERERGRPGPGS